MDTEIYLIGTDDNFNILWETPIHSTPETEWIGPVLEASDGHIYGIGSVFDSTLSRRVAVWKLNQQGEVLWIKLFGQEFTHVYGLSIFELSNGNLACTGYYNIFPPDQAILDGDYAFIINTEGEMLASESYDNGYLGNAKDVVFVPERDLIVIMGSPYNSAIQDKDITCLFLQASTLDSLHEVTYGGPDSYEDAYSIISTQDGGFAILGSEGANIVIYKTDSMGCIEPGCLISSVEIPQIETAFKLFPNPANDVFTIQFDKPNEGLRLRMFTPLGQLVKSQDLLSIQNTIWVQDLSSGGYFYELLSLGNKVLYSGKFVKY